MISLMGIGLALEGDGAVGANRVTGYDEADEPFEDVPYIEGYDKEFKHLARMNVFMAQLDSRKCSTSSHEDEPEEVDRRKTAKGNETVDNHGLM